MFTDTSSASTILKMAALGGAKPLHLRLSTPFFSGSLSPPSRGALALYLTQAATEGPTTSAEKRWADGGNTRAFYPPTPTACSPCHAQHSSVDYSFAPFRFIFGVEGQGAFPPHMPGHSEHTEFPIVTFSQKMAQVLL